MSECVRACVGEWVGGCHDGIMLTRDKGLVTVSCVFEDKSLVIVLCVLRTRI